MSDGLEEQDGRADRHVERVDAAQHWNTDMSVGCLAPLLRETCRLRLDQPFVEYVRSRGFEIIPIDYDDEMHYANNFLTIAPRHIMAVGGQSNELQQRFADAGVTVEWVPLESLIDGYGAAHCMTQVLQREASGDTSTAIGSKSRGRFCMIRSASKAHY